MAPRPYATNHHNLGENDPEMFRIPKGVVANGKSRQAFGHAALGEVTPPTAIPAFPEISDKDLADELLAYRAARRDELQHKVSDLDLEVPELGEKSETSIGEAVLEVGQKIVEAEEFDDRRFEYSDETHAETKVDFVDDRGRSVVEVIETVDEDGRAQITVIDGTDTKHSEMLQFTVPMDDPDKIEVVAKSRIGEADQPITDEKKRQTLVSSSLSRVVELVKKADADDNTRAKQHAMEGHVRLNLDHRPLDVDKDFVDLRNSSAH